MVNYFSVVDLFCGIGGLTHGFVKEGCNVTAGIDFDNSCKYAYEKNNKTQFLHKDIGKLKAKELTELFGNNRKILIGYAPCQPYSIFYGKKGTVETSELIPLTITGKIRLPEKDFLIIRKEAAVIPTPKALRKMTGRKDGMKQ